MAWTALERSARAVFGLVSKARARFRPGGRVERPPPVAQRHVDHADERTIRRIAEAQSGGVSSEESAARFARGDNPGGLHHRMVHHDGPEHQRPELEEPQERDERRPGHSKHLAAHRRGA